MIPPPTQLRKEVIRIGKKNNVIISYLSKKERFSDFLNALLYDGRQLIKPEKLEQISGETFESLDKSESSKKPQRRERRNDVTMRYRNGHIYKIYISEMNEKIHYALPLRNLEYAASWYKKQYEDIRKKHISNDDFGSFTERMSGINKNDRLIPVTIIWFYHGEDKWDGPRNLRDMMDFKGYDKQLISDFRDFEPILVCANELKKFDKFKTELKLLMQSIRYKSNEKDLYPLFESDIYENVDEDTLEAMSVLLEIPSVWKSRHKYLNTDLDSEETEARYNMCTAVREHEARIRRETRKEVEEEMCTAVREHEARIRRETWEEAVSATEISDILKHAQNLMKNLKCSAKQALDLIGIEENKQSDFLTAMI